MLSHWVIIHKARDICTHHSRIPLPEIYSSLSEAFYKAYTDETEAPGVGAVSALGRAEVCWIAVLPGPGNLRSWLGFERNSRDVAAPDARGLETMVGILAVPLKGYGYSSRCECTLCNLMNSHPLAEKNSQYTVPSK